MGRIEITMEARYEIDQDGAVNVYFDGNPVPTLYQPNWPNGDEWADEAEASEWAELYIAAAIDQAAPYAPNFRGQEPVAKPTPEQLAQMKTEWEARNNTN